MVLARLCLRNGVRAGRRGWKASSGRARRDAVFRLYATIGLGRARISFRAVPAGGDAMSRSIGPLASFDESALRELAPRGAARSFPKNAVVINEGDQTDSLYILLSGRAKVFVSEEDGREAVLSTIREGDYFGELVLDGGPRSASIMTLEPCRCFVIPLGDIEGLL